MDLSKQYYMISEVAEYFGIKPSKIRYWESQFPHLAPKRRSSGVRKYTAQDIQKLQVVAEMVGQKGMTIEGAKQALNHKGQPKSEHQGLINKLTEIRDFLQLLNRDLE